MNSKKFSYILLGLIGLICLGIIGGAYEANSLLQNRSTKLLALKTQSSVLDQKQLQIIKDRKDIATYKNLNVIAKSVVPQDKDQAEATLEIVNIARSSGIPQLSSITFPTSTLGSTGKSQQLTQLTKVPGVNGVYDLQITVQQANTNLVTYDQFLNFVSKLQQNRRTAQISSITVQPDSINPNLLSFSLVIDEFIKP